MRDYALRMRPLYSPFPFEVGLGEGGQAARSGPAPSL